MMKTFSLKASEIQKNWILIDAENIIVGRLAADIATRLRGKHKARFTPHMDCGDHIIIINAEKISLTGRKMGNKIYYRHTGYPGGIKSKTAAEILSGKNPEHLLIKAVRNMMPKNVLSAKQLKNLYVYAGSEHPHQAQKPMKIDFAAQNRHNSSASSGSSADSA